MNFDLDRIDLIEDVFRNNLLSGLNVTIPYKEKIIPYIDELSPIAKEIGSHYEIDIDLLVSGVCLHQIGNLYSINLGSKMSKSNHKSLVGNAIISRDIVNKYISDVKNFPEDDKLRLEHLILSYQGRKEWQSPVEPQTLEAILLHSINFLDSLLEGNQP